MARIKSILNKYFDKNTRLLRRFNIIRLKYKEATFLPVKFFYYARYQRLSFQFNCFFPLSIDASPTFPHGPNGVFISSKAQIGNECVIFHQVTIGSNTLQGSKSQGAPQIGHNVFIGAGAKIIGNVSVGNNVRIGANCIVSKDVPDNSTVVLQQPTIIERATSCDNSFIPINLE